MTCIVGLIDGKRVILAGDSNATNGAGTVTQRRDPKVFRLPKPEGGASEMIVGFTHSYRMGQLLRFGFGLPPCIAGIDAFEYMARQFTDATRARFRAGGYSTIENNEETGGTFLVGYAGRLFEVESDFQVGEPDRPYAAIGSGEELARGALYASETLVKDAEERARIAIAAAATFNAFVGGPVVVEILEPA